MSRYFQAFLQDIRQSLDAASFSERAEDIAPHCIEWRHRWQGRSKLLLKPKTPEEVATIVRLAGKHHVPLIPQGGNTGLVGGGVPDDSGAEVILLSARMNRIRSLDKDSATLIAEAGVTLLSAQQAAEGGGFLFPLSLPSEGSATLGGAAATNAGGVHVLRYGSMRDLVLGVEAVLADGSILHGLSPLRKNNSGYALAPLLIGSEGTLAIITALSLKLFPLLKRKATAIIGIDGPEAAVHLLQGLRAASGDRLLAFEYLPRFGMELVTAHMSGCRDPFDAPHPAYALVDIATSEGDIALDDLLEQALAASLEKAHIRDAVVARSAAQTDALWSLRHLVSEAQKHEGASLKHDISVPVSLIPAFLRDANAAVTRLIPGIRPCPFGHIGDGNIHYNLSQPLDMRVDDFIGKRDAVASVVNDMVIRHGGSISAEHGIGRDKIAELERLGDPAALRTMRTIKAALDPKGIFNPGRVIRTDQNAPQ